MEYSEEYRNENDGIARFVSEKLVPIGEGDEIVPIDKTTLRRVFKQWCSDNELRLAPNEMEKRVEVTYGKFHKGGWTEFQDRVIKSNYMDRNLIQIFTCVFRVFLWCLRFLRVLVRAPASRDRLRWRLSGRRWLYIG